MYPPIAQTIYIARNVMKQVVSLFLSVMLLTAAASAQAVKQPLYILLYARVTDHVNADISEDRLRRLLPMIETYQKQHPAAHVSAAVLFSGAASQALAERNAQTHIVDFVRGYVERGVIEAGYDGTDEPTYVNRPTVDFTQTSTPQDRWLVRWNAGEKFLTEGRDPLTGAPQPGKPGGLKEMQAVFGEAAWITGVSPLMRMGPGSLGGAVTAAKEPRASEPSNVPAYSGFSYEVGGDTEAAIRPALQQKGDHVWSRKRQFRPFTRLSRRARGFRQVDESSSYCPEVYWQDNVLRSSETSNDDVHLLRAFEGVEAIKKLTAKADRSRVHVIHVEVASEQDYLLAGFVKGPEYPALKYAYDHPQDPKLPADALYTKEEINAAYANEEALLKWVTEDFIPAEPGSRIVASGDLLRMAEPNDGFTVSTSGFLSSLADYMKAWGEQHLRSSDVQGGRPLSFPCRDVSGDGGCPGRV